MSKNENKPTTRKQMTLIVLIVIVFLVLAIQLLAGSTAEDSLIDRETCLNQGDIWSESAQECFIE